MFAHAAHILSVPVCVFTDNSALVDGFGAYKQHECTLIPEGSSVHWVPGHGRHEKWTSRVPLVSTRQARALGDRADETAVAAVASAKPALAAAMRACRVAGSWAELAVRRLARPKHGWHDAVVAQSRVSARM